MVHNYTVIKEGNRFTIGEFDEGRKAYIINDGIYSFYWWDTADAAQAAADAYNAYGGCEWLGEHGYGNDRVSSDDDNIEMVELYRLFDAVDDDGDEHIET